MPCCVPGVTCCCLHRANATRTPWRRWARQTQGVGAVRRRPSSRCQAASLGGHTGSPGGRSSSALPQIWPHAHARQLPHTLVPSSLPTPHPRVALGLHLLCLCPLSPHSVPGPPSPVFRLLSQRCLPLPSSIPLPVTHTVPSPRPAPLLLSQTHQCSQGDREGGQAQWRAIPSSITPGPCCMSCCLRPTRPAFPFCSERPLHISRSASPCGPPGPAPC